MKLALPKFQFRFMPAMGNIIFPGNFHPVGTRIGADALVDRALAVPGRADPGSGGTWLVMGSSGGFGSAARIVAGAVRGAHTLGVSLDGAPNPESNNKIRKIGSPGWHRNAGIERRLSALGTTARSINGDAFDPTTIAAVIAEVREHYGGKIDGIVWALAAPRAKNPRTGKAVNSVLKPLGKSAKIKTLKGRDPKTGEGPSVSTLELPPGSPEEAIATIFVMGGGIVTQWHDALAEAGVLANGCTLLTVSYRGNALNAPVYRDGLIGLAKADLEYQTRVIHAALEKNGGRAIAVEGPAVVTEASGGIPGVSLYLASVLDVMGDRFEDPLASMLRMFRDHLGPDGPTLDEEGLLRMDDVELSAEIQAEIAARFEAATDGSPFPDGPFDAFMRAYSQTRGFDVEGVDYDAEFDTDAVCEP
ncbi:MAG: hypothetical protein AAF721_19280 [Myxococcota bacterium]